MITQVYKIPKNFGFYRLFQLLSQYFGFTYLHDQGQAIFAIYPKQLQVSSLAINYLRDCNFLYQPQATSSSLIATNISKNFTKLHSPQDEDTHFHGGMIIFCAYDFAAKQHIQLQHPIQTPHLIIGEYDIFIKKVQEDWYLFADNTVANAAAILELIQLFKQPSQATTTSPTFRLKHTMRPRWSKLDYVKAFDRVQTYLHAGDCYQINLTQEFCAPISSGRLSSLFPQLLQLTQAPFAAYLHFDNFELLSCSPELFIEFQAQGKLKTRPIKGTVARHTDPTIDQTLKEQLANSTKDQAENLMIVDLLRNDLSVYAETGSVHVPKLFEVESFAQVHHLVSEIQATLKPDTDLFQVLLSALPGGSITGAPKIRAMQIIDELEGQSRGAYCGSIGYLNYDGTGRFNILIRTLQRYDDQLSIWAGGGITVASDVDAEYQECLDKVSAILDFLNQYAESQ